MGKNNTQLHPNHMQQAMTVHLGFPFTQMFPQYGSCQSLMVKIKDALL